MGYHSEPPYLVNNLVRICPGRAETGCLFRDPKGGASFVRLYCIRTCMYMVYINFLLHYIVLNSTYFKGIKILAGNYTRTNLVLTILHVSPHLGSLVREGTSPFY
jgi:hypothetical protein